MTRYLDCGCCITDTRRIWCPTCSAEIEGTSTIQIKEDKTLELSRKLDAAIRHLKALTSILGPCSHHDHHGYCQSHFVESPCRVAEAVKFLDSVKVQ